MATTDSPLNIKGSIKGLRFYQMEGSDKTYVGQKGGASREHIRNSKVFEGLRKAENELRGRALVAKSIRFSFGPWSLTIVNRHLQVKLAGILSQVQDLDTVNPKGLRRVDLTKFKEVLNQVVWHYYKPLDEIMMCPYSVETREDKRAITVTLQGLNPRVHIKAPPTATHFQLCLGLGTVTDCYPLSDQYFWSRPFGANSDTVAWKLSEWIPIDGPLMEEIVLTATLREKFVLTADKTVIRGFGILFGKMTSMVNEIPRQRGSIKFLGAI